MSGCRWREGRIRRRRSTRNKTMQRPPSLKMLEIQPNNGCKNYSTPPLSSLSPTAVPNPHVAESLGVALGRRKHLVDLLTSQDSSSSTKIEDSYFFAMYNRNAVSLVNSFFSQSSAKRVNLYNRTSHAASCCRAVTQDVDCQHAHGA